MKQILVIIVFISLFIFSCNPASLFYYDFAMSNPVTNNDMSYSDEKIDAKFSISRTSINFQIRNRTNEVLKIIWDEGAIIQNGRSKRITHSGVNYINRGNYQPPTVIPANTRIDDSAIPTENVYFREAYGIWFEKDLFIIKSRQSESTKAILNQKGQKFSLYQPISYQGNNINYNFEFVIKDVAKLSNEAFSIE
jgi:hypothetical protein